MRLSKPYPTTNFVSRSKSLRSDNVNVHYFANVIGDTYVQTWYTVHTEYGWKSLHRQFAKLIDAKKYAQEISQEILRSNGRLPTKESDSPFDRYAPTIVLVEHVADSHVIDWKN